MSYDHILMIGFGGPTKPEEIIPFLQNVTRGIPIPAERLKEVEHHYHEVGGFSPYNEYTWRLFNKLNELMMIEGVMLQMFLGMRNWTPLLKDTFEEIKSRGLKRGLGLILAPHRSDASFEKYIRNVDEAKQAAGVPEIQYKYLDPWFDHPGFIEAQAEQVTAALEKLPPAKRKNVTLLFTAHSIPVDMASKCHYADEVKKSSELVAQKLGISKWQVAWQSRSGSPQQPWLEPDVISVIRDLKAKGEETAVLVPVGFLCDNVEVLFDLDIEAKKEAETVDLQYLRASTVMDHPRFVEMFLELISAAVNKEAHA